MSAYSALTSSSHVTFDDEFNSFVSSPNGTVGWMTRYPYQGESARALPGNGEAEYYSDSSVGTNPFSIHNGVLDITATRAKAGSNPDKLPYTSGIITTYHSFAQEYGFFAIRAKLPAGQGLWPAFWMLPDSLTYTTELDVFEVLGSDPNVVYETVHSNTNTGAGTERVIDTFNTSASFNTFGVDWEPTTTTFYIDGVKVASIATPASMDKPMYMLADLAVGAAGSFPGAPNRSTAFPASYQIDWVRAYATANTIEVSGTAALKTSAISGKVLLAGAGVSGVTVALLNAAGVVIATTKTGSGGSFTFAGLAAGDYQVRYTPPGGLTLATGSEANSATGLTASIALAQGQSLSLPSEALVASASITGRVLLAGAAAAGVKVTLLSAGKTVATATTDSAGGFTFGGLQAGAYQVKYTAPAGDVLATGGPANTATGLTASVTVTAGQAVTLASETVLAKPANIQGIVAHFGGASDPAWGGGDAGVSVSLLDASGSVIATTTTAGNGWFIFRDVAAGTYQLQYTPPIGQAIKPGTGANATTHLTATFTLAAGESYAAAEVGMISAVTMNGTHVTDVEGNGGYVVTGDASNSSLTLGAGNQSVTLTGGGNTVVTGNGNQNITLSGKDNHVTIGSGTSTVAAGDGDDVVHAAGGHVTISATGGGNLFDGGAGISFLNADGSAGNVFVLNAGGSALLTTISGFNTTGDTLDLQRTLSGTSIASDLANVARFVTAAVSGANTILSAAHAPGSAAQAFAVLENVHVSVAQLVGAHDFSLN